MDVVEFKLVKEILQPTFCLLIKRKERVAKSGLLDSLFLEQSTIDPENKFLNSLKLFCAFLLLPCVDASLEMILVFLNFFSCLT